MRGGESSGKKKRHLEQGYGAKDGIGLTGRHPRDTPGKAVTGGGESLTDGQERL